MTASEILSIVITVALSQLGCDLLARYFIYSGESYKRTLDALERARWKLEKAQADAAKNPTKHEKRLQRTKDEFGEACSNVSKKHTQPGIWTSIFFVLLLRILGTEHKGKIMAVLPFVPFRVLSRITGRGLDWSAIADDSALEGISVNYQQGTSFLFIYMLSALSVKFFINKALATQPPPGADKGLLTIMESPGGKRMMKSFGIDPDELLKNE